MAERRVGRGGHGVDVRARLVGLMTRELCGGASCTVQRWHSGQATMSMTSGRGTYMQLFGGVRAGT